jgi:hypothetical protein
VFDKRLCQVLFENCFLVATGITLTAGFEMALFVQHIDILIHVSCSKLNMNVYFFIWQDLSRLLFGN